MSEPELRPAEGAEPQAPSGDSMTRRDFLRAGLCAWAGGLAGSATLCRWMASPAAAAGEGGRPAQFWKAGASGKALCLLCPRKCLVSPGERGSCGARENRSGTYHTMVYGKAVEHKVDPIERLPMFHLYPGMNTLAVATSSCNLSCKYCQSWQFAQARPEEVDFTPMSPSQVVAEAKAKGCQGIAFTYAEPVNFIEYAIDIAEAAHKARLITVCHTAAYVCPEPFEALCDAVDAVNIDLKAFTESFYDSVCDGHLEPVLKNLQRVRARNKLLELTTLVIPTLNDSPSEIRQMCQWVRNNVGPDVPMHFSRFFPAYRLKNLQATPRETVENLRKIAFEVGIKYAYVGNLPGHGGESTYCPKCQSRIIHRVGYNVRSINLRKGRCAFCSYPITGFFT